MVLVNGQPAKNETKPYPIVAWPTEQLHNLLKWKAIIISCIKQ